MLKIRKKLKEKILFFGLASLLMCTILEIKALDTDHVAQCEIVVTIPSYNNKDWCIKNLDSVFAQDYPFYEVIYVDDCSTDGTYDLVEQYIKTKKPKCPVTLIKNETRQYHLANRYRMNCLVPDHKIIVELDGDDWFPHPEVLSYLAKIYANPEIWLTYGQFQWWPDGKIGYCKKFPDEVFKNNSFRDYKWVSTHLRTYRAWLFKHIKKEDLFYKDAFFQVGSDEAYMFPMLEMAGGQHIRFIPDVLCIRNRANPIKTSKVWPREYLDAIHTYIRSKPRYARLQEPSRTSVSS